MALPQKLFVKEEEEREPEDNWLHASPDFSDLPEQNEVIEIGIYELKSTAIIENKTILKC